MRASARRSSSIPTAATTFAAGCQSRCAILLIKSVTGGSGLGSFFFAAREFLDELRWMGRPNPTMRLGNLDWEASRLRWGSLLPSRIWLCPSKGSAWDTRKKLE